MDQLGLTRMRWRRQGRFARSRTTEAAAGRVTRDAAPLMPPPITMRSTIRSKDALPSLPQDQFALAMRAPAC